MMIGFCGQVLGVADALMLADQSILANSLARQGQADLEFPQDALFVDIR